MRGGVKFLCAAAFLALCAVGLSATSSYALDPYDVPEISCETSSLYSITLHVCGGASGAPAGVSIQWTTLERYEALGNTFPSSSDPDYCALSLSGQPSLQHPGKSRWELIPGECADITIGDINFDETGVSGGDCAMEPLQCGTDYVFRIFAHAGRGFGRSPFSDVLFCSTQSCDNGAGCTCTQGGWKQNATCGGNNPCAGSAWPANTLVLGSVTYDVPELCAIFNEPAKGNGLISLAHQLMAAKLNILNGSGACALLLDDVAAADALIGNLGVPPVGSGSLDPSVTSYLNDQLTAFNEGVYPGCPAHCTTAIEPLLRARFTGQFDVTPVPSESWGSVKTRYR